MKIGTSSISFLEEYIPPKSGRVHPNNGMNYFKILKSLFSKFGRVHLKSGRVYPNLGRVHLQNREELLQNWEEFIQNLE